MLKIQEWHCQPQQFSVNSSDIYSHWSTSHSHCLLGHDTMYCSIYVRMYLTLYTELKISLVGSAMMFQRNLLAPSHEKMAIHLLDYTVSEPKTVSSQSLLWATQTLLTNCLCGQFGARVIFSSDHFDLHRWTRNSTTRPVEMSCSYYPYWQGQRIHTHQSVLIVWIKVIPEHEIWPHEKTAVPILSKLGLI